MTIVAARVKLFADSRRKKMIKKLVGLLGAIKKLRDELERPINETFPAIHDLFQLTKDAAIFLKNYSLAMYYGQIARDYRAGVKHNYEAYIMAIRILKNYNLPSRVKEHLEGFVFLYEAAMNEALNRAFSANLEEWSEKKGEGDNN